MAQDSEFMQRLRECKGGETCCIAMKDKNIWLSVTVTKPDVNPNENTEVFIDEVFERIFPLPPATGAKEASIEFEKLKQATDDAMFKRFNLSED